MVDKKKKVKKHRFSILWKTIIIIVALAIVVTESAMTYFSLVSSNKNKETYLNFTDGLALTSAKVIDKKDCILIKDKVDAILETIPTDEIYTSEEEDETKTDEYMAHYAPLEKDAEFQAAFDRIHAVLVDINESNAKFSVTSIYLAHIHEYTDSNGEKQGFFVYLCDSAEEDPCPPGWCDPLYEQNRHILDDQTAGLPAYLTDTGYGYLITSASYIDGSDFTYVAVDVSMTAVRASQADSIIRLFVYMVATILLVVIIGMVIVYFIFNRPLKRITDVAKTYNDRDPKQSHENFVQLEIKTHDELADLADSIKLMEQGVHERITELTEINKTLIETQNQANKMSILANKDPLTGVKSKVAYHTLMEEVNAEINSKEKPIFGLAVADLNNLKKTNDDYGHNAGDMAIIRLSNVISLTFKHSPVYRVGGDEFVILCRDEDYKNAQKLVEEFNERISDLTKDKHLPPYERIAAAIGYVRFDAKKDKNIDDTFNRADKLMYKHKREMKAKAKK